MMNRRVLLAVLIVVVVCIALAPGVDLGYSRAESGVSHACWSDGPEAATVGGAEGSGIVGYERHLFEPSGLLNAQTVSAPRRMSDALGQSLLREALHGPSGPTGAQMRLLSSGGEQGEERPLLLLTFVEGDLRYTPVHAEGTLKVRWQYASTGLLPEVVYDDGVFRFEMAPRDGDGEVPAHDPVWQAVGGVTVDWRASGLFAKGHAEARMAEAASRAIFEVLRKCWAGER